MRRGRATGPGSARPAGADPGALRAWVEELAMILERDGLPRMAGRIFGWLVVCEPPEQTLEELGAALQGSKASMSTMTRLLVQAGLIERVRAPGERRDRYRIREGQWEALWSSRLQLVQETAALVRRGVALLSSRPALSRRRAEELHEQYAWLVGELPEMLARWKRARGRPAARRGRGEA